MVSPASEQEVLQQIANCIRILSADGVQKAKSGHPGLPLGAADVMTVLWQKYLRFNPEQPDWINRDRFILSAGHGSMLLYSLLHLYGYDLPLDELKNFRQLNSKTPGHPEYRKTPGVETSTGPLGQGFGNAVGMAIGYEFLRAKLSKNGASPLDHKIYVLASDGDIMEGITSEAASLAGHLNLSNIVVIYDDNDITIEGDSGLAFSENVEQKFTALGWNVYTIDGHDFPQIDAALKKASGPGDKPSLVIARTKIGKGSVNFEGSPKSHGAPLGDEEIVKIKQKMGYSETGCFCVLEDVTRHARERVEQLKKECAKWNEGFSRYLSDNPDIKKSFDEYGQKPSVTPAELLSLTAAGGKAATRSTSGAIMQYLAKKIPYFMGGSADLSPSTSSFLKELASFGRNDRTGRNFHFGVREHAMGSIMNGLAVYGNFIPFGSTFLVFSDYMKSAIRMSALMKLHVVYIFTHDSIFVGEDGPTHQPIEHIWGLRTIPNLDVIRPADATETAVAWAQAVMNDKNPTVLVFTRQNVPSIDRTKHAPAENLLKGAYVLSPEKDPGKLQMILLATGSEVTLALDVQKKLAADGLSVRVVSMPCREIFERQDKAYQESVLPPSCARRVVIEAGVTAGWHKYAGCEGLVIGIDSFCVSAPAEVLAEKYGFTPDKVYAQIREKFERAG